MIMSHSFQFIAHKRSNVHTSPFVWRDEYRLKQLIKATYRTLPNTIAGRQSLLLYIAQTYSSMTWEWVVSQFAKKQPDQMFNCTLAVFNSVSAKLEWISMPCDKQIYMSTVICQKDFNDTNCPIDQVKYTIYLII